MDQPRLPFDAQRVPAAEPSAEPPADGPRIWTVSQVNRLIREAIADRLPPLVIVVGQLSNVSRPSSGHLYFTLKDAESELRCAMWRPAAQTLKFAPTDGLEVLATGQVDLYLSRGQVQLYVRRLEPRGVGALELAFRQLREKLQGEGLFDPVHKQPLPVLPRRVALITSPTGAAVRDVLTTLARRSGYLEVFVLPVRVQGEGAAKEIAEAVRRATRWSDRLGGLEVLIVGRGGGSLEDLWAFNEEAVARAVFASRIPVVSAVGHESDVTICDLVADLRAATPTAAAELVAPARDELLADLANRQLRLSRLVRSELDTATARLSAVARHECFRRPMEVPARLGQRVDELEARLALVVHRRLDSIYRRVQWATSRLLAVQPAELLTDRRQRLDEARRRIDRAAGSRLLGLHKLLQERSRGFWQVAPVRSAERARQMVFRLAGQLDREMRHRLASGTARVEGLSRRLEASSHRRVLARGFSLTRLAKSDTLVTRATQVRAGQRIQTETAEGSFDSRVLGAAEPPSLFDEDDG